MNKWIIIFCLNFFLIANSFALSTNQEEALQQSLQTYLQQNKVDEHISGIVLTVSEARGDLHSFYAGTIALDNKTPITRNNLFQIGSNTKVFTSVILLQLESEYKLNIHDTIGKFFPQYKNWKDITIEQLLNMTSGIANYSDMPSWSKVEGKNIQKNWSREDLIKMTYPEPLGSGYAYTNTAYLLAAMIAEKVTGVPFVTEMRELIQSAALQNTYYEEGIYPNEIINRLVSGYYYNLTDPNLNPLILSQSDPTCSRGMRSTDLKCNDMSWAAAAGGMVSNTEDLTSWVRKLFTEGEILRAKQYQELKSIVAIKTGKPIKQTDAEYNRGFGLGIAQGYEPTSGHYWYYQGETLGYRVIYAYFPPTIENTDGNGLIITIATNSQSVPCMNHLGQLIQTVYGVMQ